MCPFCDLIARGVASRHGSVAVIVDAFPVTRGHTMITPLRHVADFFDLTGREVADVHRLLRGLREELRRGDAAISGFNIGVNCGEAAGQTVPHAHVHLIPRRHGDTPHPEGGVRGVIPGRMRWSPPPDPAQDQRQERQQPGGDQLSAHRLQRDVLPDQPPPQRDSGDPQREGQPRP